MDMEMRHFLAAVATDIGKEAVAGLDKSLVPSDPADGPDEAGNLLGSSTLRKIVPRDVAALGDDEDVDRRRRIDVVEGERMLVLMNLPARQLATQDPGEDVGIVIGTCSVDRHSRLLRSRSLWPLPQSRQVGRRPTSLG